MKAHLTLPYQWMECDVIHTSCAHRLHVEASADDLNSYVRNWVLAMLPPENVTADGSITLRNNDGLIHNEHGPAVELPDGTLEWWQSNKRHRVDGPAIQHGDGAKEWWSHGKLHRVNGPSIISADGFKQWYTYGKLHRRKGPAVEKP